MKKEEMKKRREFIELCCLFDYLTRRKIDWYQHPEDLKFGDWCFTLNFLRDEQEKIHSRIMDLIPLGQSDALWYFEILEQITYSNRNRLKEFLKKSLKNDLLRIQDI